LFVQFFTDDFKEQLRKLVKKDKILEKRLLTQIQDMAKERPVNQQSLSGALRGKWKMRVGDYRMLYVYCVDCKKCGHQIYNRCVDCETNNGDDVLRFFEVFHRSNDYKV